MWHMVDYESMHEEGLYSTEVLKKDDRISVLYNMGGKKNVENDKLRGATEEGISLQNIASYKRGKNALDSYTFSKTEGTCGQGIHQDIIITSGDKGFQALCGCWIYIVDIRERIILRNTVCRVLFDFEFGQLGCHDSCSGFKAVYFRYIKQYGRKMGCGLY